MKNIVEDLDTMRDIIDESHYDQSVKDTLQDMVDEMAADIDFDRTSFPDIPSAAEIFERFKLW